MTPLILVIIAIACYLAGTTLISVMFGDERKLMFFLYINGAVIALGLITVAFLSVVFMIAMLV